MPAGTIENTKGAALVIRGLGWFLPISHLETITSESAEKHHWLQARDELAALVTATDIEIKDQTGTVVPAANVENWINDVDVNAAAPAIPLVTYVGTFAQRVPLNGRLWLAHNESVRHTEVGFIVPGAGTIRTMFFGTKQADSTRTYDLRIYSNPATTPTLVVSNVLVTTLGQRTKTVNDLNISLPAGEYGMRLIRASGTGRSSFNQGLANVICEIR